MKWDSPNSFSKSEVLKSDENNACKRTCQKSGSNRQRSFPTTWQLWGQKTSNTQTLLNSNKEEHVGFSLKN